MKYAVIAAGEGSRLVGEGVKDPKPLVKINGEAMIDRLIRIFIENKAESINIIINSEMQEVRRHLDSLQLPVPLHVEVKSTPSSMHSFFELREWLRGGRFCLTTVDTMFREDEFSSYISRFEESAGIGGLMAVTDFIDDEKPLYVETDKDLNITGFRDNVYDNARYISGGVYGLTEPAIDILERAMRDNVSRMRNYQRRLVSEGMQLKAYPFTKIIDVDHAGDIEKAARFVK